MIEERRLLDYLNNLLVSGDRWVFLEENQRALLIKLLKGYLDEHPHA